MCKRIPLLFLLISSSLLADKAKNSSLVDDSLIQQKVMIQKFGVLENQAFKSTCDQLIKQLQLVQMAACKVLDADFANAYSFADGSIFFTKGLLKLMKNKHQLASVLSHEWAHVELDHFAKLQQMIEKPAFFFSKSKLKKLSRKHEQQADDWADKRLRRHKLDPDQINHYLLRLQKTIKKSKHSSGHKQLKNRLQKHSINSEIADQTFIQMVQSL